MPKEGVAARTRVSDFGAIVVDVVEFAVLEDCGWIDSGLLISSCRGC